MSAIRSKNTAPEIIVRRMIHQMGYRFRLHVRNLPGRPDIVLPRHKKIVEVRGCFWHAHHCGRFSMPSTRRKYWGPKLRRNKERDRANVRKLRRLGWRVLVVWECSVRADKALRRRLARFLGIPLR
jgi:DNA mismatch endonuclease (patch repair protein)